MSHTLSPSLLPALIRLDKLHMSCNTLLLLLLLAVGC
jgi:hypothetical protein